MAYLLAFHVEPVDVKHKEAPRTAEDVLGFCRFVSPKPSLAIRPPIFCPPLYVEDSQVRGLQAPRCAIVPPMDTTKEPVRETVVEAKEVPKERRGKVFVIDGQSFFNMLTVGKKLEIVAGFPTDAQFRGWYYDYPVGKVKIMVESESYDPIPDGQPLPEVAFNVTIHDHE